MVASTMSYGVYSFILGKLLLVTTQKGICQIAMSDREEDLISLVKSNYQGAIQNQKGLQSFAQKFDSLLTSQHFSEELPLDIQTTPFQERVFRVLKQIPYGTTLSYREVALAIGLSKGYRAVARACATNPIALLIPCHRVICSDGSLGGYRWGLERKMALLQLEKENKG